MSRIFVSVVGMLTAAGFRAFVLTLTLAAIEAASSACSSTATNQGGGAASGGGTSSGGSGGESATGGAAGATGPGGSPGDAAVDVITSDACVSPKAVQGFDATPSGGGGYICNATNVTGNADSVFAGLDCMASTQEPVYIDGQAVCGCVGVDFGSAVNLDPLFIRARATANACGTPCDAANCNTGHSMLVFKGSPGAYTFVQRVDQIATTPGDYPIASLGGPTQYIVICRFASGAGRDDIEVDAVYSEACQ